MFFIAHRGNISGPNKLENHPDHILTAIKLGYDVEVDVWLIDNKMYSGHDAPLYLFNVPNEYRDKIWFHCKNINALVYLLQSYIKHKCFCHEQDDYSIVSPTNHIWTYPGLTLTPLSIAVLPETVCFNQKLLYACSGICSDYIKKYKENINE